MIVGEGKTVGFLSEEDIRRYTRHALSRVDVSGKRVLVLIPDMTRDAPIPLFFRLIFEMIGSRVSQLDYLVATGTHAPMDEDQFCRRVGLSVDEWRDAYRDVRFFNHEHDAPESLVELGTISETEILRLSDGLMREEVPIVINKRIFDYDLLLVLSPIVPHETAGFSGGNKYLFPGIAGMDDIAFFHWMGAVITNPAINGTKDNPVRRFLNRAASFVGVPCLFFNMVADDHRLCGLYISEDEEAWSRAVDLSAARHIVILEKPYERVLGITPPYYEEVWVAGKVMYKLEPIVADGGELIIYGPHVTELSVTFNEWLRRIGYHTSAYFLANMDRYRDVPRGVLAHSANVRGVGTFENGLEKPRIRVTLATAVPEEVCLSVNLGYRDHESIDVPSWKGREDEGVLVVENAGGTLYRLKA